MSLQTSAAPTRWATGLALLTLAAAVGGVSPAKAALYEFWPGYESYYGAPSYVRRDPGLQPRPKARRATKKQPAPKDNGAKPQGPLVIAISIDRQRLKLYDANGLFAEAPVSTGMRGHPTPMGVFSVIQKHKFHHSNIYSNAPMPYMQRITWSGVALHAGVLPGYPASHGCIRMPMSFAIKMWNWTRMGARVVVTPGELSPNAFSHPLLASVKVAPQPAANLEGVEAPFGHKADKGAPEVKTASSDPGIALRPGAGHETVASDAGRSAPAAGVDPKTSDNHTNGSPSAASATADVKKDQTRLPEQAPAISELPKRTGQIAVFISRKDSKLYVRQNLAPLFETPITIAQPDQPLGTHVFTAQVDENDPNALHWSVISVPASVHYAREQDAEERVSRRGHVIAASLVEAKPLPRVNSPGEALDRITIRPDVMTKISAMLTTGASIIVSDQGINQGETGEGTDFIVRLR